MNSFDRGQSSKLFFWAHRESAARNRTCPLPTIGRCFKLERNVLFLNHEFELNSRLIAPSNLNGQPKIQKHNDMNEV